MATVAIVGAGDLGGAAARALAAMDRVDRILLIDAARGPATGKALDIQQSGAVDGFHTRLDATDDISEAVDCRACILADRFGRGSLEWSGDDGLAMLATLERYITAVPIVFAGSLQAPLLSAAFAEIGIPRHRLIGSSPQAFASAVIALVAMEARCSPKEVSLTVVGGPGRFVIPWREASIAGYALDRVLEQVQLVRLEARAERIWPPGTSTLGTSAARVTEALLSSSRRSYNVFTILHGEFGVRNRVGALPARLAPSGVVRTLAPALDARERTLLDTALAG